MQIFQLVSKLQIFHSVLVGRWGPHQSTQRLENQYFDMSHAISETSRCRDSGAARTEEPASLLCQKVTRSFQRVADPANRLSGSRTSILICHMTQLGLAAAEIDTASAFWNISNTVSQRGEGGGAPSFGRIYIFHYPRQQTRTRVFLTKIMKRKKLNFIIFFNPMSRKTLFYEFFDLKTCFYAI